ncbi:MAG: radical SAM protein [Candidatus Scalindua sp.]|nr:radical SAM protein [Candidatus Scalindua sp.]
MNFLKDNNIKQKLLLLPRFAKKPRSLYGVFRGYVMRGLLNKPFLRSLELNITPHCNISCEVCYASKYIQPNEKIMSVEEYRDLWRQAKKLGAFGVHIIGGEPTLRGDLFDIISVFEPEKYLISIVTNGVNVNEKLIKDLSRVKLFNMCISLDADNEKENDKIRGKGSFERTLKVIELCEKHNIIVEISFTLCKSSMKMFERMLAFTRSKGILLGCSTYSPTGRGKEVYDECLGEEEWEILRKNFNVLRTDFSHTFKGVGCPGGTEKLCISPYGDVQTCAINPISFGNIRKEPLEDIWRFIHNECSYYHKNRKYPRCVVSWDKEYQEKILKPSSSFPVNPVKYRELIQ